jgi:hypothetical protein
MSEGVDPNPHARSQWTAKVMINEVFPIVDRIFKGMLRDLFYRDADFATWVGQLNDLYFQGTIGKTVYREMLERHCWLRKLAALGDLYDLKSFMDFCDASTNFKGDAAKFTESLTQEELAYVRSL